MKNHIKKEEGITLITLVITIVLLLIVSGAIMYGVANFSGTGKFNRMKADIEQLHDKILVYYQRHGELPTVKEVDSNSVINLLGDQRAPNDSDVYYEIDIARLENITLNFGSRRNGDNDYYIVNSTTFNVYYVRGIELQGTLFHVGREYIGSLFPQIPITTIKVGDYVNYDHGTGTFDIETELTGHTQVQTFDKGAYTETWRVMYNDENGIEIISAGNVANRNNWFS